MNTWSELDDDCLISLRGYPNPELPTWARETSAGSCLYIDKEPPEGELDELLNRGRVVGLSGGVPLLEWLASRSASAPLPPSVETIAIRGVNGADFAYLLGAPAIEQIRRLCVVDAGGMLLRMLAQDWPQLTMLGIYDVRDDTIAALPELPVIGRIRTLRLRGPYTTCLRSSLTRVLSALGEHLEQLSLENCKIDAAASGVIATRR